jgi:prefoldin subunit 5
MSPIGRIFIVLNLILSAAFLGWASNALGKTADYKDQIAKLQTDNAEALKKKDEEISKLTVDLAGVTEQQSRMREQRDTNEAEANRLKTQLEELKRANDQMQANLTKIQATLGDYKSSIDQLSQQKDAAIERAHEAERARDAAVQEKDEAVVAKNDAEEGTRNAQRRIQDLEAQAQGLGEEVSKLETRIAMLVSTTGASLGDVMAPPKIDAQVLKVDRNLKFVVLNKGKADKVQAGFTFSVYRGTTFKGQVRIQDVQDGLSSGIIVNEAAAITTGDSATTVL